MWPQAPRALNTIVYVLFGWLAVPFGIVVWDHFEPMFVVLIAIGGLFYSVGSVIYVKRYPNPWPITFGYHELFHVFVIIAAVFHYAAIWRLVT